MTASREQFYVFAGADGWAWCEMFYGAGQHVTAPTPFRQVTAAIAYLRRMNPGAVVDELLPADVADAMRWVLR